MKHLTFTAKLTALLTLAAVLVTSLVPAPAASAATSNSCVNRVYRQGSKGTCVGYIQKMLNGANNAGLAVDRDFGPLTAAAVTTWQGVQRQTKSDMIIDGVVGPQTWASLCAQSAKYTSTARAAGCTTKKTQSNTTASSTNKTAALPCNKKTLSTTKNRKDPCVRHLQHLLNLSMETTLQTDSVFGPKTRGVVRSFQDETGRGSDRSGTVGADTWAQLCSYDLPDTASQNTYNSYARQAGCSV